MERQNSRNQMMSRQPSSKQLARNSKLISSFILFGFLSENIDDAIEELHASKIIKYAIEMILQFLSHDHGCSHGDGGHHDHHHDDGHPHVHGGHSDVEMQIRMMASSGKWQETNGRQRSKPKPIPTDNPRDTYQGNRGKGWQNSLRGSGGYVDPPRRPEPRRPSSGQVQRQESGRRTNGQCQEHHQSRDMRRRLAQINLHLNIV